MNLVDAEKIAMNARAEYGISEDFSPASSERRVIELVESPAKVEDLPEPGPTRDIIAWVVTLASAHHTAEVTVDEAGKVVRVRRSR